MAEVHDRGTDQFLDLAAQVDDFVGAIEVIAEVQEDFIRSTVERSFPDLFEAKREYPAYPLCNSRFFRGLAQLLPRSL